MYECLTTPQHEKTDRLLGVRMLRIDDTIFYILQDWTPKRSSVCIMMGNQRTVIRSNPTAFWVMAARCCLTTGRFAARKTTISVLPSGRLTNRTPRRRPSSNKVIFMTSSLLFQKYPLKKNKHKKTEQDVALWYDGSSDRSFIVDPLSYILFQPVVHDWCNKSCGMCYPVYGMMHIKELLLLIEKNSSCCSSGFPLPIWSFNIRPTPYNCK